MISWPTWCQYSVICRETPIPTSRQNLSDTPARLISMWRHWLTIIIWSGIGCQWFFRKPFTTNLQISRQWCFFEPFIYFDMGFEPFTNFRSRFWKNTISLFVVVTLRAASILENNDIPFLGCCPAGGLDLEKYDFLIYLIFLTLQNLIICFQYTIHMARKKQHSRNGNSFICKKWRFFKVEAARRAT